VLERLALAGKLDSEMRRRGTRTRAVTAAFLSGLFPGLGQLYNRDWVKAAVMMTLTAVLLIEVKAALASVLAAAGAVILAVVEIGDLERGAAWSQLLPALAHPTVQSRVRQSLLPLLFAVCAVVLWSMADAYRRVSGGVGGSLTAKERDQGSPAT